MFKVGDFVEYVGNKDWKEYGTMTISKTYEILEYDKFNKLITIKNDYDNEIFYAETFFKPIKTNIKSDINIGDIVKVISEFSSLTVGKTYKVKGITLIRNQGITLIEVKNDNKRKYCYPYNIFEKVEQKHTEPEYDFIPEKELVYAYVDGVRGILIKK